MANVDLGSIEASEIGSFLVGLLHAQVRAEYLRTIDVNGGSLPTTALLFAAKRSTERVLAGFPEPLRSRLATRVDAMAHEIVETTPVRKPGESESESESESED